MSTVICPGCKEEINASAKSCPYCGNLLEGNLEAVKPVTKGYSIKDIFISLLVVGIGLPLALGVSHFGRRYNYLIWWEEILLVFPAFLLFVQIFLVPKSSSFKKPLELGLILLIFLGLFGTAAMGRNQYHPRPFNTDAKSNLHNLYLGCKAYWAEHGAEQICDVSTVATQEYGYVQSTRVSIYGKGPETTFTATAQHMDSTTSYTMDSNGSIK